jgi:hypothetical protein
MLALAVGQDVVQTAAERPQDQGDTPRMVRVRFSGEPCCGLQEADLAAAIPWSDAESELAEVEIGGGHGVLSILGIWRMAAGIFAAGPGLLGQRRCGERWRPARRRREVSERGRSRNGALVPA